MILVTVGSQKFQFDRLLKKIDELIEEKKLKDNVFAQIGNSNYLPKNYEWVKFLDRDAFQEKIEEADIIITHGGTGVIIKSLKLGKKIIVVPRQKKFNEHVDDHQLQIAKEFDGKFVETVLDIEELEEKIESIRTKKVDKYVSNTNIIIDSIKEYIESVIK